MKAFKYLMGVGLGSGVRATNDNVLRKVGVSASYKDGSVGGFGRCVFLSLSSSFLSGL